MSKISMSDFLKKKRMHKRALERLSENPLPIYGSPVYRKGDLKGALYHLRHYTLLNAFNWNETPEGFEFWRDLQKEYEELVGDDIVFYNDISGNLDGKKSDRHWREDGYTYTDKKHKFDYEWKPTPIKPKDNPSFKYIAERGLISIIAREVGRTKQQVIDQFKDPRFNGVATYKHLSIICRIYPHNKLHEIEQKLNPLYNY